MKKIAQEIDNMERITKQKTCETCRHFSQHYSKQGISYGIVCCGHCLHPSNRMKLQKICEYWEDIEIKKEERQKSIKSTLEFMARSLNEIAMILKDDEE